MLSIEYFVIENLTVLKNFILHNTNNFIHFIIFKILNAINSIISTGSCKSRVQCKLKFYAPNNTFLG